MSGAMAMSRRHERRSGARLRRYARRLARHSSGGIFSGRLRGKGVATRLFRESRCGVAPAPARRDALGHRIVVLVPQRTLDRNAGGGRGGPDVLPHGPRSAAHPVLFRQRGRFSRSQLPDQERWRARLAARPLPAGSAPSRHRPGALEGLNIRHATSKDTSMVRCSPPLLTLVLLLAGSPAWATGPLGPEIRFFSRSGQDPQDDLAYFR